MGFVQAPNWAQHRCSPDTVSGKQLGTLRSWVSVTTVANPRSHLPYEAFHNTYGKHPCAAHDPDDGLDSAATGAAELVWMRVDPVKVDAMLRMDAYHQSQVSSDDARKHIRCGDHKHDDHLQPRSLFYVCAIEDCAHHHAGNCNDSHYTG
jgi:hypothetical protein